MLRELFGFSSKKPADRDSPAPVSADIAIARRFGFVGTSVSSTLRQFSHDLIGLVCGYLAFPLPTAGAKAALVKSLGSGSWVRGMGVAPNGKIWLANGRVDIIDPDTGERREVKGDFNFPHGIAFAASGTSDSSFHAYIVNHDSCTITVCNPDGSLVRNMVDLLRQESHRISLALDKQGQMFVTNRAGVQVLRRADGRLLRSWKNWFEYSAGIAINSKGEIGIVDYRRHTVEVFDDKGKLLRVLGNKQQPYGTGPGQLGGPFGLACDRYDNWIVCDMLNHRMQAFACDGSFICSFAKKNTPGVTRRVDPMFACVDYDGRVLVYDENQREVHVFVFEY